MFARNGSCTIQVSCQTLVKDLIHQRTFSRSGHTRYTGHYAKWEADINVLQVIFLCSEYFQPSGWFSSCLRNRNLDSSAQIGSGYRFFILHDFFCISRCNHFAAVLSRARTDIHNKIRFSHRILIMLDYDYGITKVTQMLQCAK